MRLSSAALIAGAIMLSGCVAPLDSPGYLAGPGGYPQPSYGYAAPTYGYGAPTYGYAAPPYAYAAPPYAYGGSGFGGGYIVQDHGHDWDRDHGQQSFHEQGHYAQHADQHTWSGPPRGAPVQRPAPPPPPGHAVDPRTREFMGQMGFTPNR